MENVTDTEGRRTWYSYDADGNISCEEIYTAPTQKNVTEYRFNHLGKVVQKLQHVKGGDLGGYSFDNTQDVILTTSYTCDLNGNTKTMKAPNGVITTYNYDNMDRLTSASQPGKNENGVNVDIVTSSTYDWEGKVLTSTDARLNTTSFLYDSRGFLKKAINADAGVTLYDYDMAGRKIAEISPQNIHHANGQKRVYL